MRTGRTNNLLRREAEHGRDAVLKEFEFEVIDRTDSYAQQRGLEQLLHEVHHPPLNYQEPISSIYPRRQKYLDAAQSFLQEGSR